METVTLDKEIRESIDVEIALWIHKKGGDNAPDNLTYLDAGAIFSNWRFSCVGYTFLTEDPSSKNPLYRAARRYAQESLRRQAPKWGELLENAEEAAIDEIEDERRYEMLDGTYD